VVSLGHCKLAHPTTASRHIDYSFHDHRTISHDPRIFLEGQSKTMANLRVIGLSIELPAGDLPNIEDCIVQLVTLTGKG